MRRNYRCFLSFAIFALWLLLAVPQGKAQSLFPVKEANEELKGSSSASAASLFSDLRAHNVGDVLTITVEESTTAQTTASTKASQTDSVDAFGGTGLIHNFFRSLALTASNSRNATGDGTTSRSGTFVTTLSVRVKKVLPNGTLLVEGTRMMKINKETQKITFTGIVRPEDIGPDNTVPSSLVADVKVAYDGKGIVGDTQHEGILTRIFRFLF
ncbi:MAG TPA: flagellar basal body L-ring protein FlgH [Chthonomonas sp.]|jgi:flagellar L-ring protein precursor FlgH|uniref:flagellar basal body L-ring protein FlgH n=1 Tax=Chthonomonas sp. TaxID=2282153 RepID=UPI002B4ABDE0|nr:flagellar basal body L-ring protein FlgH [Chthonomonas sp.]HLH81602.1 flagellar basal body L-ring protein FlgH [Chthonomonas sp.]